MTDQKTPKRRRLSHQVLGILGAAFALSLLALEFLVLASGTISMSFFERNSVNLTEEQMAAVETWLFSICVLAAVGFFLILFLILLGQKLSYIRSIIKGVEALHAGDADFVVPVEDNNELTQLAETINELTALRRQVREREQALNAEKEQLIRTLSHDIRTPLTSIMSYSQLLAQQESCSPQERIQRAELIEHKAEQIKELTDILLDGGQRKPERFDDARLLMEQLCAEMEEMLEEDFHFTADLSGCEKFAGAFDVLELRRLFDNLASNIQKYANPAREVHLSIRTREGALILRQENARRADAAPSESYQMGIKSIRRIAHNYGGQVEIRQDDASFAITVTLSEF